MLDLDGKHWNACYKVYVSMVSIRMLAKGTSVLMYSLP